MHQSYKTLRDLVQIDSPTGFTQEAWNYIQITLENYGWKPKITNKGAVVCQLAPNPTLSIAAHVDTLGAIVTKINMDGTLGISLLGGPVLPSFEGEYVRIHTLEGQIFSGTLLLDNPSAHANRQAGTTERDISNMHIRLDELVFSEFETNQLNIRVGDIIAFDPKYTELPSGHIKSRFMDNKAGCFVLLELARRYAELGIAPPVELFFSNYEEVGHGGCAGHSPTIKEILVIDMGVIGTTLQGQETHCSICAKDSSGPYDYEFRRQLVLLAEANHIPYKLDVYPYYSSDGSAALKAGVDARVALIGPGVAASHGMERTHKQGIEATIDLCMAYIGSIL